MRKVFINDANMGISNLIRGINKTTEGRRFIGDPTPNLHSKLKEYIN